MIFVRGMMTTLRFVKVVSFMARTFVFIHGKYIAKFNITASQSARYAVDINVPGKGIIENKELQGSQDNISISFNIDEVVDQVEFRYIIIRTIH